MADKTFVQATLRKMNREEEPREAITKDRQQTGRAFMLRLRYKDGRKPDFIAWAMLNDGGIEEIEEDGEVFERLYIIFAPRMVVIEGLHLERILDEMETERVTILQEQNELEMIAIEHENSRSEADPKPIIRHIEVVPDLKTRVAERTQEPDDEA